MNKDYEQMTRQEKLELALSLLARANKILDDIVNQLTHSPTV